MFSHSLFPVHLWLVFLCLIWGTPFSFCHWCSTSALCTSHCTHLSWLSSFTLTIIINHMLMRMKSLSVAQISTPVSMLKQALLDASTWKDYSHLKFKISKDEHTVLLPNLVSVPGFSMSMNNTNIYLFTQVKTWQPSLNPLTSHPPYFTYVFRLLKKRDMVSLFHDWELIWE